MEKPTLFQLRRTHNTKTNQLITTKQLADMSGVELADVYMMELGRPTTQEHAEKVLRAFSLLTGKALSLSNISVIIKQEERKAHPWFGITR